MILDDHFQAIARYTVFLDDPTAAQTALALRQAIWRKADPGWAVCGVPAVLYSDLGADFTSTHLTRVCADLKVQLGIGLAARAVPTDGAAVPPELGRIETRQRFRSVTLWASG